MLPPSFIPNSPQGTLALLLLLLLSRFSRVRFCDPIDSSPPGSPVPGILQARTLESVAISSFRVSSQPRDNLQADSLPLSHLGSPTYVIKLKVKVKVTQSCPTLCNPMNYTVHGIFQARILEWVAFPFSRGSSQARNQTQVFRNAGALFTS